MAFELVNRKVSGVVVLLGLTVLIQYAECNPGEMQKLFTDCIAESGASPDAVKKAIHEGVFATDDKFKCFFKCLHVKGGDMDETGKVLPENFVAKMKDKIGEDKATTIMTNCKDSKGSDPCDTALVFSQCMQKQFKDLGFDFHRH